MTEFSPVGNCSPHYSAPPCRHRAHPAPSPVRQTIGGEIADPASGVLRGAANLLSAAASVGQKVRHLRVGGHLVGILSTSKNRCGPKVGTPRLKKSERSACLTLSP